MVLCELPKKRKDPLSRLSEKLKPAPAATDSEKGREVSLWVADPETSVVFAYRSLTEMAEFKTTDTLNADDVLPGFSVPIASLFED